MDTGRERVKALFKRRPGDDVVLDEVREFQATVLLATLTGFLLGGLVGARYAGDKFVRVPSSHPQCKHRNGCRWGWKLGVFSGIFSGTNIIVGTYRDKSDALNYIAAGGAFDMYMLPSGVKPAIGGMVLGTLLSIPVGLLMHVLERGLVSKETREEMRQRKHELYRLGEQQWENRLESTEKLIEGLEKELKSPGTAPLSSSYETDLQTSVNNDSETNSN